ncbi:MAG TPA: dockerin type I domain-containing protein [Candidatus Angelobacter sp.]|nr:dockerin type I domain-containing protein [Candidatus Angelobacter sp.]
MRVTKLSVLIVVLVASVILPALPVSSVSPVVEVQSHVIYRPASSTVGGVPPFTPAELRKGYGFSQLYSRGVNGTGERIAIVDAFGSPTLAKDLAGFNSLTGLPPATVNLYFPDGVPKLKNTGWAVETSLDVEWAHAMAPGATIDLVVALSSSLGSIFDAISFVANSLPGERVLSMSFGQAESLYPTTGSFTIASLHQLFVTMIAHGTTLVASSGDSGASSCCNIQYPASDPLVLAVGGTSLTLNPDASYAAESAWSGSTAGSSIIFSKPAFQTGLGDSKRDDVDVAYDADPNTGVLIVFNGGLLQVGGTSAGAPQWSALVALASQIGNVRLGVVASQLYRLSSFHDVTTGSDGFFSATPGWDYPTGLGSPNATATVLGLNQLAVPVNNMTTFHGITVTTNGTLTVSLSVPTVNGALTATARNSTTLAFLFSRTYTVPVISLAIKGGVLQVSFLLNIALSPYPLSSDLTISLSAGSASATVLVTRQMDFNGDGLVDFLDASTLAFAYGSGIGSPNYNPQADLDANGTVDFIDASIIAFYYSSLNLK